MMLRRRPAALLGLLLLVVLGGLAVAQIAIRNREGSVTFVDPDEGYRPERYGVPDWEVKKHMPDDLFTFVRVRYESSPSVPPFLSLSFHPLFISLSLCTPSDPHLAFTFPIVFLVPPLA